MRCAIRKGGEVKGVTLMNPAGPHQRFATSIPSGIQGRMRANFTVPILCAHLNLRRSRPYLGALPQLGERGTERIQ